MSTDQAVLEAAQATDVSNARLPSSGLITAAQPDEVQLAALQRAGAGGFVSLRPATEEGAGWEEAYAASEGIAFSRLPISGADDLTRENVEEFAELLDEHGEDPLVVYCGSSNRVGALVALKAHWIDGVAAEEALEMGMDAGLTRLEGPVRELLGLE